MSGYTQMDGELELPLPWWVEPLGKDPQEMKVRADLDISFTVESCLTPLL